MIFFGEGEDLTLKEPGLHDLDGAQVNPGTTS
jgi:hypothetical protein